MAQDGRTCFLSCAASLKCQKVLTAFVIFFILLDTQSGHFQGHLFPHHLGVKQHSKTRLGKQMGVVGTWKQRPWGRFPCPVPAGEEKTTASTCYVAYYPYLYLSLFLSQAVCCCFFGGVWSIGKDVRRKVPLERRYVFTRGRGKRRSNVASLDALPFGLSSRAKAVCKAVLLF